MRLLNKKTPAPDLSYQELALLLRLGEQLGTELDLENVLALVAETARQVVQAETLTVPLIDANGETFTYRAASGKYGAAIRGQTFAISEGACGWVFRNRQPLLFGEGGGFALDASAVWEKGMASSLLVPLVCRGAVIGGLSALGKRGPSPFNLRDQTLLTLFANQASIAIDNARLFKQLCADEERVRLVLDAVGEAIYGIDTEGRCTFANPACLRLLGYAREDELLGKPMHALIHYARADGTPLPLADCPAHRLAACGSTIHADTEVYWRRDGTAFPVECWAHPKMQDGKVIGAVMTFVDITARRQTEEQIYGLAYFDSLTGLPNRRLLLDRLGQALLNSVRTREFGALMMLDLDNFKGLNDTQGHDAGDRLLVEVAQRIVAHMRSGDTVCRLGGDEYVVMMERLGSDARTAAKKAEHIAEKLRVALGVPFSTAQNRPRHFSTASFGVTLFRGRRLTSEDLLKQADVALYQAKGAGRNTIRFFNPEMQAAIEARAEMETALRRGLQRGEFRLFYQPQVDHEGQVTGAEALLRWLPPGRSPVAPSQFIPLAEETGLILPLGLWVIETACNQLRAWARNDLTRNRIIAINVSARQFRHPDFVDQVHAALAYSGADPRRLKLELTESMVVENVEEAIHRMQEIKALGVTFALDDFGTGYSSLSHFKRLPVDQVKIDQSFVRDVSSDPNDAAIVRAIIAMSQTLGVEVIAEGVETGEQLTFLRNSGCGHYQGYLFGRPTPIEEWQEASRGSDPAPARDRDSSHPGRRRKSRSMAKTP
ncbi:MAG: EAL domain-containing protein [Betaproteobacteria bacterium]|nr:EAL domain-containing protein [Betaproteobacteria bacterium]